MYGAITTEGGSAEEEEVEAGVARAGAVRGVRPVGVAAPRAGGGGIRHVGGQKGMAEDKGMAEASERFPGRLSPAKN